jgi:hypothetical protein
MTNRASPKRSDRGVPDAQASRQGVSGGSLQLCLYT